MTEIFQNYLKSNTAITDSEINRIISIGSTKNIRKWKSLLNESEVWNYMCFITSGSLRLYRTDNNGIDHTVRFGIENWWMLDPESYLLGTPAQYNIEAIAPSSVIVWTKNDWLHLMHEIPELEMLNNQLFVNAYRTSLDRIYSLISKTAEERYFEFQNLYPNVYDKVPLHMVASYLGISRETLSRVRRDFLKK